MKQADKRFCIVRDKIEQAFEYNDETVKYLLNCQDDCNTIRIGNLILELSSLEKNYRYCYTVSSIQDSICSELGTLYWGSYNTFRQDIYFKVNNERLYDTANIDIEYIASELGLKPKNIPTVDLAADFNFNVIDIIYKLYKTHDTIILNKHRDKKAYINELTNIGKGSLVNPNQYKGFTIKTLDSTHKFELVAYDKTLEINTQSHKDYIHEIEGMEQIYRLEVRASRKDMQITLKDLNISDEEFMDIVYNSKHELIEIWKHLFDRLLRFRKSGSRKSANILELLFYTKAHKPIRETYKQFINNILDKFSNTINKASQTEQRA